MISHWNLRDELKANYADPAGLTKQRLIATAMERIVTQTIPRVVINNPKVDWLPDSNEVRAAPPETIEANAIKEESVAAPGDKARIENAREPDTRYERLLATFRAARRADPYSPSAPSLMARRFDEDRELTEARVEELFKEILTSRWVKKVAQRIEERLRRKLEPFDIWYDGFLERSKYPPSELDAIVRKRYPNLEAFASAMPRLLEELGFTRERAQYLAERIVVDPSRGAGHAMPALRRGDKPHLRTRVEKDGMNYKGFNIAVHEMGHNVEQVFSLYNVDYTLLSGVPNNAFTEARTRATAYSSGAPGALGPFEARPRVGAPEHPQQILDDLRDLRPRARGHGRVALDVPKPRGNAGVTPRCHDPYREGSLERILCASLWRERCGPPCDLLPHGQPLHVPTRLSHWPLDRAPDRGAFEGEEPGRGV